jgi:DNA-binding CsgD family transcriptional regulator
MVRAKRTATLGAPIVAPTRAGNLTDYVDAVRQALRTIDPTQFDNWHDAYESGLREAYLRKDLDGLVSIAMFGAACLDAQGFHEEALDQLDFAMSMSRRNPDAGAYLLSLRALYESLCGYFDRARESLALAVKFAPAVKTPRGRLGLQAYTAAVDCISLADRPDDELSECIPLCEAEGLDWLSSALRCWYVPYLLARGKRRTALPWIETLRVQAEAANHPARLVDASVFELAARSAAVPRNDEALIEPARRTLNANALWRLTTLHLRNALIADRADVVDTSLALLRELSPTIPPLFADGAEAFPALVDAYRRGSFEWLPTPQRVGLVNLPCVFAGIEAVAIAGSQDNAAEWKAWSDAEIPSLVMTALDWPVSLARIRGLLHVRAGSMQSGARFLRDAIRWADDHEYAVEAALARLQLGEVLSHGGVRSGRMGEARAMRKAGWSRLPELGVTPAPQAYAATRAVSLNRDDMSLPRLTGREIDVVALLAEGRSYKEIGETLQISWRTAQLHANRVYSKLGVHGKMQAVAVARELKIL